MPTRKTLSLTDEQRKKVRKRANNIVNKNNLWMNETRSDSMSQNEITKDRLLNIKDNIQDSIYESYDIIDTNISILEKYKLENIISRLSNISNEIDDFWFRGDRERELKENLEKEIKEKEELKNKLNKLKEAFPDTYNVLFNI